MALPVWEEQSDVAELSESGERPVARASSLRLVSREAPAFDRALDCFGVPVSFATWESIYRWFFESARSRSRLPKVMYFANAHTLNLAWNDAEFRSILGRADAVLNDGIGVDVYARLAGAAFAGNFNGTDLFPRLFACADPARPLRVFLYGAAPGRAEKAARNIEKRFPGVRVVGTMDGYSRTSAIEIINEACPDVLLVGMGNPIQEQWIDENRSLLDVGLVAGVGALIDFLSGEIDRAPQIVRALRCEWLYRLACEPRRMFRRYVLGNPAFLLRTVLYVGFGVAPPALGMLG
jgi:exopolysaccharide biosynthesis WecB/TagA/CpsF family protein